MKGTQQWTMQIYDVISVKAVLELGWSGPGPDQTSNVTFCEAWPSCSTNVQRPVQLVRLIQTLYRRCILEFEFSHFFLVQFDKIFNHHCFYISVFATIWLLYGSYFNGPNGLGENSPVRTLCRCRFKQAQQDAHEWKRYLFRS